MLSIKPISKPISTLKRYERRNSVKKFLKRSFLRVGILTIPITLTNCSMLGIHDQSFECPPEEGMKCTSASAVNRAIDQFDGDVDQTLYGSMGEFMDGSMEGSISKDSLECQNCNKKNKSKISKALASDSLIMRSFEELVPSNRADAYGSADYIREPDQTMRIWIAPRLQGGVMMEESFARIVSKRSAWKKVSKKERS
jgi:hypothetical protein